ncbi:unnamed protein product [Ambrosiozyma monospora]|uniref:Unnamed protein product n=1 Tax=Ambrosiozyma monospora TaxID=43982 RepID=A0ACB5SX86_AMBMO|nr:unnamed protein product [Ambrosiozyma monospora]
MSSLKKLTFFSSKLNCKVIENLPDTITDLSLFGIESCDLKGCSLMLPTKLQRLRLSYNSNYSIHKFSNTHQLNELCELKIYIPSKYSNMDHFLELKSLLHSFPCVKCLYMSLSQKANRSSIEMPLEKFSLDKLACLKYFSLSHSFESIDLSNLPPCLSFYSYQFPKFLTGQFPSCLESLDISLFEYNESFESFWKRFISPLENICSLKVTISQREQIDFRGLEFPPHLHTVEIGNHIGRAPCHLNFDQLPDSIICFVINYYFVGNIKSCIFVDNANQASVDVIKRCLVLEPPDHFEWKFKYW